MAARAKMSSPVAKPVVIAISQNKGGTAKTTTTINLGAALSRMGRRVFLIDLDPQANLSSGLGIDVNGLDNSMYHVFMDRKVGLEDIAHEAEGMRIAPAHISMVTLEMELVSQFGREWLLKRKLEALDGKYDYVLIDCPPSLGLTVTNALAACHYVLLPVQTQAYALYGVPQLMEMIGVIRDDLNPDLKILGVLLTFTNRTRLSREVEDEVKKYFQEQVFTHQIRQSIKIAEAPLSGQSVLSYAPDAAEDYVQVAQEVDERVNRKTSK